MRYTPKLGGYRPDNQMPDAAAHQAQDLPFSQLAVKLKAVEGGNVIDLRSFCSPVEDQGQASSCVANATVGALECLEVQSGQPLTNLSRLFIYYNSRLMQREQDQDNGTFIRLAFGTLSSLGTCSEDKWPYDLNQLFIRPSWGSYREAYAHKITSFYRLPDSGSERDDAIIQALQARHPVAFGMTVDQAYMHYDGSGPVAMPASTRAGAGGHAQLIVGVDVSNKLWIVRNSWGIGWGQSGYALVPWAYLDASDASDFWCATNLK